VHSQAAETEYALPNLTQASGGRIIHTPDPAQQVCGECFKHDAGWKLFPLRNPIRTSETEILGGQKSG
jgi:hypothetical protein